MAQRLTFRPFSDSTETLPITNVLRYEAHAQFGTLAICITDVAGDSGRPEHPAQVALTLDRITVTIR